MNEVLNLFKPNKMISKSTVTLMVSIQIGFFIVLWIFSPFVFLPTPQETLHAFSGQWDHGIAGDIATSFMLNLQAIAVATILSLFLAYATVLPFFRPIISIVGKFRFLSLTGLTFFFTMMTHSGHELKLYLLVFSISVFFVDGMVSVLNAIPKEQYDLARSLRMGGWREVWEVVIIGQADKAFDVLRQNAAIGFMMLTMVESMSRTEGGVGNVLTDQSRHFYLADVMAIQIAILIIGLGQDYMIGMFRNMLCPYATLKTERK